MNTAAAAAAAAATLTTATATNASDAAFSRHPWHEDEHLLLFDQGRSLLLLLLPLLPLILINADAPAATM